MNTCQLCHTLRERDDAFKQFREVSGKLDVIEAERDAYRLMYDQLVDFVDERELGEDYVRWLEERLEKNGR